MTNTNINSVCMAPERLFETNACVPAKVTDVTNSLASALMARPSVHSFSSAAIEKRLQQMENEGVAFDAVHVKSLNEIQSFVMRSSGHSFSSAAIEKGLQRIPSADETQASVGSSSEIAVIEGMELNDSSFKIEWYHIALGALVLGLGSIGWNKAKEVWKQTFVKSKEIVSNSLENSSIKVQPELVEVTGGNEDVASTVKPNKEVLKKFKKLAKKALIHSRYDAIMLSKEDNLKKPIVKVIKAQLSLTQMIKQFFMKLVAIFDQWRGKSCDIKKITASPLGENLKTMPKSVATLVEGA